MPSTQLIDPPATHYFRPTLNARELQNFDLAPLICRKAHERPNCLAQEISDQIQATYGQAQAVGLRNEHCTSISIPFEVLAGNAHAAREMASARTARAHAPDSTWESPWLLRSMQATTPSSGGFTVGTELMPLEDLWRATSAASRLGAQFSLVRPPQGDPLYPTVEGDVSFQWLGEGAAGDETEATLGTRAAPFKRLAGGVIVSKQLLAQAPQLGTRALSALLFAAAGVEIDRGVLVGTGGSEPTGITTAHSSEITFGAAATYGKFLDMELALNDLNVPNDGRGFAFSTTAARKLREKAIETGDARKVLERINGRFECAGYPAEITTLLSSGHRAIHGRFGNVQVQDLRGAPALTVVIDPFTRATMFQTVVWVDMLISTDIRPDAFCVSTDSAAQ